MATAPYRDDRKTQVAAHADLTTVDSNEVVNASGHVQELQRNFNLVSLVGVAIVVGNVWPAIGGSILVAIFNGGPPGRVSISRL